MILSVVIPVFNEARTVVSVLEKIMVVQLTAPFSKEIIIVDDCSTDGTDNIIRQFVEHHPNENIIFQRHEKNRGKGAALQTGFKIANGDYCIVQDADLEYDPEEFNILLKPVVDGYADVVYGSRFVGSNPHRILFFWHTIGNKFLTFLSNMLTNLNLTDMETCYKLIKSDVLKKINLKENRFGFEPEITAKIARIPEIRIYEVGVSYYGRTYAEGKKINWRDGFRAIYCIFKYNIWSK